MPDPSDPLTGPPPGRDPDPLAAALARLAPAPAALDRDRLMFQAGAASRRAVVRLWQATAGFLAAIGFVAGMYFRPPLVIERVVPAAPPSGLTTPVTPTK